MTPQYKALIAKLSDPSTDWGLLAPGWDTVPTSTPEELQSALQRLYDGLYATYVNDHNEAVSYEQDVYIRDREKAYLASLEQDVGAKAKFIATLRGRLQSMQAEIAQDQHIEDQLELAAEDLRQATTSDQDETIGWIVATLPRAGVNAQAWGRWNPDFNKPGQGEIAETPALTYIGPERDLRPVPPEAAMAVPADFPTAKAALPDSMDDRMAAVNQMAIQAHDERQAAQFGNNNKQSVEAEIDQISASISQDRNLQVNGDIIADNLQVEGDKAFNALAIARVDDNIAAQSHAAAVVTHWIWSNVRAATIATIKSEVTRYLLAAGMAKPSFTVDDAEVQQAIDNGRSNIFGLTDGILKVKKLANLVRDVGALANHTADYASVVASYAASASPEQTMAAVETASRGLDQDAIGLQRQAIDSAGLREPFKSVWLRLVGPDGATPP